MDELTSTLEHRVGQLDDRCKTLKERLNKVEARQSQIIFALGLIVLAGAMALVKVWG